ncbi:MAG: hypothetical protein C4520_20925 [Candidatus Abyssobacteria bacterium SURF_5]|uniref:Cytochrome c-552/4 domain-containing protein n=1 Tax=Abyssobacteria bacterium (strain SURF_5) TaxID=2093360 RepID=A0A3A4N8F1_ABYX5|nr:MAG: hypothetical protein C4520_20925 [Candidatus Abyssubacteria bacterium SURF_5]
MRFAGKEAIVTKSRFLGGALSVAALLLVAAGAAAWTPLPVVDDPLVRMPGTQPGQGTMIMDPQMCLNCHGDENILNPEGYVMAPGYFWQGSVMAQAARDPLFYACMAVAGQDSIWAVGNPNAVDICERCHFPQGWLAGRSDPPNASLMTGTDFDGVHCDACHMKWDPFFATTFDGTREGSDWAGYWDEAGNTGPGSGTPSQVAAEATLAEDALLAAGIKLFSGLDFFIGDAPKYATYTEDGAGQYFMAMMHRPRASFADTKSDHPAFYSRHHKSKYFCSTCHNVSNPVLANACEDLNATYGLSLSCLPDQSGGTDLITEQYSASRYFHVERTFAEFEISAYGQQGGAATNPEFHTKFDPPITWASSCQDCHMRNIVGKGCEELAAPLRPIESTEHPNSGAPMHDMMGGNVWLPYVLASTDDHFPDTYDPINFALLTQGPLALTLDMYAGLSPTDRGDRLLAASDRAKDQLKLAATIKNVTYNPTTGNLAFRVQNNTGHKLISGFPEGRRMFVNIKAYAGGSLIHEVNPYDYAAGTLKGLSHPSSPPLGPNETYVDALVYEVHPKSQLTGEDETFHFVLASERYKDNRIPPKGFDIVAAAEQLIEPVDHGVSSPAYFTAAEYAGGYDDVSGPFVPGADSIVITLYYQSTSREYIEFLRDEINGTADTLSRPTPLKPGGDPGAYIIQTDPFFGALKAWGDTIWELWFHNHGLDGLGASVPTIVPFQMTQAQFPASPLTTIHLLYPPDLAVLNALTSPPTFVWSADGGANVKYAIDFSLSAAFTNYVSSYETLGVQLPNISVTIPQAIWDSVPTGTPIYWRVRGADTGVTPITPVFSTETWSFVRP